LTCASPIQALRKCISSLLLIGWTACVWFSIVYLGEHYVVDALDGVIYVAVAVFLVEALSRRTHARSVPAGRSIP